MKALKDGGWAEGQLLEVRVSALVWLCNACITSSDPTLLGFIILKIYQNKTEIKELIKNVGLCQENWIAIATCRRNDQSYLSCANRMKTDEVS